MNERIQELKKQASSYASTKSKEAEEWRWIYEEKFAELIVMECMTICEELGDQGLDGHYCADKINKTFRI